MVSVKYHIALIPLILHIESILAQYYPFLTTVYKNQDIVCGSVVIHKNYLLTVASCFASSDNDKYYVLFGDPKMKRKTSVNKVINIPLYQEKSHKNDLVLLHLLEPLPLTDDRMDVKRIQLAKDFVFGECFTISIAINQQQKAGSIRWSQKGVKPPHPKYNDFSVEISPFYDNSTIVPVLKGSPLICGGTVVGLFSSVHKALSTDRILVLFTQVSIYVDWIEKYVGNTSVIGAFDTVIPTSPSDFIQPPSDDISTKVKLNDQDAVLIFIGFIIFINVFSRR